MKTKIEVVIGLGNKRPIVRKRGSTWTVTGETEQCVQYGRGLWAKTFLVDSTAPMDGKGFLVGPTGKLTQG